MEIARVFEIGVWSDVGVDLRKLSGGKDPRTTSIGVLGFMFCFDDDFASQLKLVTAAALNDLDSLVTMPQESESLRCAAGGAFDNTESSRPSEEDKERAEPTSPDPSNARPAIDADQEIGTEAVWGTVKTITESKEHRKTEKDRSSHQSGDADLADVVFPRQTKSVCAIGENQESISAQKMAWSRLKLAHQSEFYHHVAVQNADVVGPR